MPLHALQVIYMVRMKSAGPMSMVSLVTSWWSLGMGVGKIVRLKDFLPYRNKQVLPCLMLFAPCPSQLNNK